MELRKRKTYMLAQVTTRIGNVILPDTVIYSNAFDNLQADIRYRYDGKANSLEQDIILHEATQEPARGLVARECAHSGLDCLVRFEASFNYCRLNHASRPEHDRSASDDGRDDNRFRQHENSCRRRLPFRAESAGGKYKLLSDDIASVAYWYQAEPHAPFPALAPLAQRGLVK